MRKIILTLLVLSLSIIAYSQNENPFAKFGYDVLVATSSKGEFVEFHDQTDIVEIGSVLFNRQTKEIVKVLDKDDTTIDISSATAAMSIDPLCEKYYWISPYAYCANNPIRFIDLRGDSISVAEEHRNQFNSDLNNVFGNYSQNFSYTSTGMLTYSGSTKGMSKDQKASLKGLTQVMNESTITNVIYGTSMQVSDNNGNSATVNASDGGGAITLLASENPNLNLNGQNTILIGPSIGSSITVQAVTPAYYLTPIDPANGARFTPTTVATNVTDVIFHEIGHVIHQGKSQNKVIDYNNSVRRALGLGSRPYDETHNRNVKKGNY